MHSHSIERTAIGLTRQIVGILATATLALAPPLAAPVGAQMPDVGQMSGVPLPTGDLPNGSVSVRVVRGDLSNNVVGQAVELHGGGQTLKATTDAEGRALFTQAAPGTSVHAVTTVDGARIESQEFAVPATGGIRVVLVAGGGSGAAASAGSAAGAGAGEQGTASAVAGPAQPGTVVLGGQSRFVVEMADEALDVYQLFEVANTTTAPVEPAEPLVFTMPDGGRGLTLLEGSSPQATVDGNVVKVEGPFRPGMTSVQFAYQLPYSGASLSFAQPIPVALNQTAIVVRKVGAMSFLSPQAPNTREVTSDGNPYIMANGTGVPAGSTVSFAFDGLPHRNRVPRYLTLALAGLLALWGVWVSLGREESAEEVRKSLESRREQLLRDLVRLEEQHRAGRGADQKYLSKRQALVTELERLYSDLDRINAAIAQRAVTRSRDARASAAAH